MKYDMTKAYYMKHNFHIHTMQSTCAKEEMTVENIILKAESEGFEIIGLSDHFHQPERDYLSMASKLRNSLDALKPSLHVWVGCEAQMLSPGQVSIDQKIASDLDYVIIAADHYHLAAVENPIERQADAYAIHYLKMLEGAIDTGFCDVIAHPFTLPKVTEIDRPLVLELYDRDEIGRILSKAVRKGVSLELNPNHISIAPWFFGELSLLSHRIGIKFTIGTDAHLLSGIGYQNSTELEQLGFAPENFVVPGSRDGSRTWGHGSN
jgi:histidinol phosphatase-like PHP family hydrolase